MDMEVISAQTAASVAQPRLNGTVCIDGHDKLTNWKYKSDVKTENLNKSFVTAFILAQM